MSNHHKRQALRFNNHESALQMNRKLFGERSDPTLRFIGFKTKTLCNFLKMGGCLFLFLFSCNSSFSEIKNGYEKDILMLKQSLKNLTEILMEEKDLSAMERRKIESKVETLVNHISFYDLTETLLKQFRLIAPKLYAEVDTICDQKRRPVNIYVKFVPLDATKVKAWGITYINQVENDKDAYLSEYGAFTVSVKIWIVPTALKVLSHELGHVKYQVPHLASYIDYHKKNYTDALSNYIGHNADDPSGTMAIQSEKFFRREYVYFLKTGGGKIQNPLVLLTKIRKSMSPKHYAVATIWRSTVTL